MNKKIEIHSVKDCPHEGRSMDAIVNTEDVVPFLRMLRKVLQ